MTKATFDPSINFCIRQVRVVALEIGAHGLDQLLDGDISSLDLICAVEIAKDVADGASGRMGRNVSHTPTLRTSTFPPQYSRATVISHAPDPQISAISADRSRFPTRNFNNNAAAVV
jgi:hypothetical protein